jgi:hypothetical protein
LAKRGNERQHDYLSPYTPVGKDRNAFKPKKNNNKKKGQRGKDEPDTLDPSMYPTLVFLSDVDPETIVSQVTH